MAFSLILINFVILTTEIWCVTYSFNGLVFLFCILFGPYYGLFHFAFNSLVLLRPSEALSGCRLSQGNDAEVLGHTTDYFCHPCLDLVSPGLSATSPSRSPGDRERCMLPQIPFPGHFPGAQASPLGVFVLNTDFRGNFSSPRN